MALNKHWCVQGTIDSTQMIYRYILKHTKHTQNYTHIRLCSKYNNLHKCARMAQLNYTNVLSWHNGKLHTYALEHSGILHTCALMAQHCTQNHRYLAGLLMMRPYLVRTGVAACRHWRLCRHWSRLVCRLRPWKWSVPWTEMAVVMVVAACHWCPGLSSQVYTGLLVRRRSWVRLLSHRVVWREDCSWLLVTEVIWIARRWRDLFQMSAVPTQVTSWCLYQEWTRSALPHHLTSHCSRLDSVCVPVSADKAVWAVNFIDK